MRQHYRLAALACMGFMYTHAAYVPLREVPISEATQAPGVRATNYTRCSSLDLSEFTTLIKDEADDCSIKTSYRWTGTALPTTAERRELCKCTALITKIQQVTFPRCTVVRDDREISYAQFVEYAFGLCSRTGGTAAPTNKTTSMPTLATTTSLTPTPSASQKEKKKTTAPTPAESKSDSKTGVIVAVVGAVVVVVAVAIYVAFKCGQRRRTATKTQSDGVLPSTEGYQCVSSPTTLAAIEINCTAVAPKPHTSPRTTISSLGDPTTRSSPPRRTDVAIWDDPVLLAVRVPYDAVFVGPLLSRGGYGEVYKGTYRGETVAIKQLLPERRKDLAQIDAFLGEVLLMSSLEHERIVRFIGVAWNALSDACAVVEYMEHGDLRSVLSKWATKENRPQGFDTDKLKIALHVAHALTYLHSLEPVVVHRDLKSRNVLLNARYDAKLTDFGVSRERTDTTMTPAIGSSLWMAPEVMLGERYDEKADIFSFGIVLSELDSQKLPYADVKDASCDHRLPDSAILQMVSHGRLQITFSETVDRDLVCLGLDCVQLDAKKRPTAAEVLHRIHQVQLRR